MIRWEGCSRFRAVVYPETLEKISHRKVNCNEYCSVTVFMYLEIKPEVTEPSIAELLGILELCNIERVFLACIA